MEFVCVQHLKQHLAEACLRRNSLTSFYLGNGLSFIFSLGQIQHHLQLQQSVLDLG